MSHLIVSGESGGGNLTLTVVHKANREGWLTEIAGALGSYFVSIYNSRRVQASYRLISGDEVRVPPVRQPDATNAPPPGRLRTDWIARTCSSP